MGIRTLDMQGRLVMKPQISLIFASWYNQQNFSLFLGSLITFLEYFHPKRIMQFQVLEKLKNFKFNIVLEKIYKHLCLQLDIL